MAYRTGDRLQLGLLPASIEDYVSPEDPVRAYDAFVEALDLPQLGIEVDPNQVGNAAYITRCSAALRLSTGYAVPAKKGCHHNLAFVAMAGRDHKTIMS